jgi:uncharacterized protein (DUF427 family)
MKTIWQDTVIAESDMTIIIEGNHYFPPDSIKTEHFSPSDMQSTCHWKGTAKYYHAQARDKSNPDAVWCYPEPKQAVRQIKGFVAFWRGIKASK